MTPATPRPVTSIPVPGGSVEARTVAADPPGYFSLTLHYLEDSPIVVRGSSSGRQYTFSGKDPDQLVDARDAQALLRTRFFRRNY